MEGLKKIESAVAGSEEEGLYGLLRGAISHSSKSSIPPPHKKHCHTPTANIYKPPPQEPGEAAPEASVPAVREVPSSAVSQTLVVAIPTHMAPLCLQLGVSRGSIHARVERCSEGPSTSHATICVHMCMHHLGLRLACPSCAKTFLNLDALRHHRKIHND